MLVLVNIFLLKMNKSLITREILNIEKWILKLEEQIKGIELKEVNSSGGGVLLRTHSI